MEKYEKIKVVGKGSFGAAWLVRRRQDGKKLIAKEVQMGGMKPKERDEARNETRLLSQMKHPNITQYHESFEHHSSLFIVMEFADGGDLAGRIRSQKGIRMKESQVMNYFAQLCLALNYLHERHTLHRDLKCQNVFLTSNGVVKLGDFGIATVLRNTMALAHTICGTPYYFSPELCQNKPYNNKSDIWALGCILYEITTLQHAFEGHNMKVLMQKIIKGVYPPISYEYSRDLRELIGKMLSRDYKDRPSINQIIQMPFVQGYICTLGKILDQGLSQNRSIVADDVKYAARMEARDRMLRDEKQRHRQDVAYRDRDRDRERDRDAEAEVLRKKREYDRNLELRMEKMRIEQQQRMREAHCKQQEIEKMEMLEKEKRRKQREEELNKWRERKKQEQKENGQLEAKRAQQNRAREEQWDKRMLEMEQEEERRREARARENEDRAKAGAKAYWDMRKAAEENKRRAESAPPDPAPQPHPHPQPQPQPHGHNHNHNHQCGYNGQKQKQAEQLLKMQRDAFREMHREAARNKARFEAGMHGDPGGGSGGGDSDEPRHLQELDKPPEQEPQKSPTQPTEEERKAAFQRMRREARRNKERFEAELRGDPFPEDPQPQQPQQPQPQSQPPQPQPHSQQQQQQPPNSQDEDDGPDMMDQWVNNEAVAQHEPSKDEWVGDYKDMVHHIEALKSSAALPKVSADEEFFDTPGDQTEFTASKFMLDGKTLNLPNVKAGDPLMYRIEALRMFLSEELGEPLFLKVYRRMDDIGQDDSDHVLKEVRMMCGEKVPLLQLVSQLIFCEDQFNTQNKQH